MNTHPDRRRLPDHDGEAVLQELAYLSSKLGSLERELLVRRRRAGRTAAVSTTVLAVAAVAGFLGAHSLTRSVHLDLVSWRAGAALGLAAVVAGIAAGAFAARGAVRSLVTYVVDASR